MDLRTGAGTAPRLDEPAHARAAASHPNPYPYYARLAVEAPLYREAASGTWIATSAATVTAVLTSPLCVMRPVAGPVPDALAGTAVAEIFRRLLRVRDGAAHCSHRRMTTAALDSVDMARLAWVTQAEAAALAETIEPECSSGAVTRFMATLPVHVVAGLLGVERARFADVGRWIGDYGAAVATASAGGPAVDAGLIETGNAGARQLFELFRMTLDSQGEGDDTLLAKLARAAGPAGDDDADAVIGAGIGLMAQGFLATGALIGVTLLALARHPDVLAAVRARRDLIGPLVEEVMRCDPVAQNTPRFVARDGIVAGQAMREGDPIIAVLAAANRDPALNPDPARFDIYRTDRRHLEFGIGRHACPGERIATLIAETAVSCLLDRGIPLDRLAAGVSYRPSAHARLPIFTA
jgi:cytochrome P450